MPQTNALLRRGVRRFYTKPLLAWGRPRSTVTGMNLHLHRRALCAVTAIELAATVAILGVIIAIAVPVALSSRADGEAAIARLSLQAVETALSQNFQMSLLDDDPATAEFTSSDAFDLATDLNAVVDTITFSAGTTSVSPADVSLWVDASGRQAVASVNASSADGGSCWVIFWRYGYPIDGNANSGIESVQATRWAADRADNNNDNDPDVECNAGYIAPETITGRRAAIGELTP
jgi:type II secretory pathway pseudopilin PulG